MHGQQSIKKLKMSLHTPWNGGFKPLILNHGIRRRWEVSLTPKPSYFLGESPRYPFNKRPGGRQSSSGRFVEEIPCSYRDSTPRLFSP